MPVAMAPDAAQQGSYRVFVRVRPMSNVELAKTRQAVDVLSQTRLRVAQRYRPPTELKVNRALGPDASQEHVFETVSDVIEGVVHGRCGTVLAYGQTGSGKTYMMSGPQSIEDDYFTGPILTGSERGLIPRALECLFGKLSVRPDGWRVRVSFIEVYNEQVYDLLDISPCYRNLELREGRCGAVEIPGLQQLEVRSLDQALLLLEEGSANRVCRDNGTNATSSRSHALFQVLVEHSSGSVAKLSLVDLAGSEKLQPGHGAMNAETTKINLSLTALGQCIAALLDSKRKHVPYRNSKLTRLLQESLQDPLSATVLCVCISPSEDSVSETMSALQFADRAKRVVLPRRDSYTLQPQQSTASVSETTALQRRVEELTAQLAKSQEEVRRERMGRMRLEQVVVELGGFPMESSLDSTSTCSILVSPDLWEQRSDCGDRGGPPEGTSTLELAFQMAKQGLEDILSVVEILDHNDVAVSKAKQGLQEIVSAVDTLHCISMEAAEDRDSSPQMRSKAEIVTQPLCRSNSTASGSSRSSCSSYATSSCEASPQTHAGRWREGTRRNIVPPNTKSVEVASPLRKAVSKCWEEYESELQSPSSTVTQGAQSSVGALDGRRRLRGSPLVAESVSNRGSETRGDDA